MNHTKTLPSLITLGFILVITFQAQAETLDQVICETTTPVLSEDLKTVEFDSSPQEKILVFQGWGENEHIINEDGADRVYKRVSFPNRGDGNIPVVGWIPKDLIKSSVECLNSSQPATPEKAPTVEGGTEDEAMDLEDGEPTDLNGVQIVPSALHPKIPGAGLSDPSCCLFPLNKRVTSFVDTPAAQFGWRRKNRTHGGADLYGIKGQTVRAVADGFVFRGPYPFYRQTYAMDVEHPGGFVVRYAELGKAENVTQVTKGQKIGTMGQVRIIKRKKLRCCHPMIHVEIYSGEQAGPLTNKADSVYNRRLDLIDPTEHLLKWQP